MAANEWFKEGEIKMGPNYKDGYIHVSPNWLCSPQPDIAARLLDLMHAEDMSVFIKKCGLIEPLIRVLIWIPEPCSDMLLDKLKNFDFDTSQDKKPNPVPDMNVIVGDHTRKAATDLHNEYPKNKQYKKVPVRITLHRKTEEDRLKALHFGTLDNTIRAMHKKMSMWDCILQMRRHWLKICQEQIDESMRKQRWQGYKLSCENTMPYQGGTFHTMSVYAQLTNVLWDPIYTIMNESEKGGKGTKSKAVSMSHFGSMSGIPKEILVDWLKKCVRGTLTTKDFLAKCKLQKKKMRIEIDMVEHVNIIRPVYDFGSFDAMARQYPVLGTREFIEIMMASSNDRVKDKLNAHCKDIIKTKIEECEKQEQDKVEVIT